ncbi:MAG: 4-hydroxythreonine-4-phosphate dehydrogenase PdxA [Prevotella sp.]|nr:4-hydroxythreonine-4-phosphate dehydrogenase PdxA [Prevotella sp.]
MEDNRLIRVAITHGDTNGIGYEVILKTFEDPAMLELCTPIIYGSPKVAAYHRKALNLETNFSIINSAEEARDGRLNLLTTVEEEVKVELGHPSQEAGQAALKALDRAVEDYRKGLFDVLVTAPINKNTIQGEDFHFPGHTEYIEEKLGDGAKALMILMNDRLRVALVTTHLPLKDVATAITQTRIVEKAQIFHRALKRDLRISNPRIAVLSLNPHAGDGGVLGSEEQDIILPAINELEQQGIQAFGPYPADGFFGSGMADRFDGVLAMYHDQGLAPFKTLALDSGVNFTTGLPIVRTSPDHGTAYDIAGRGKADENSMRQAIYTAIDVYRNRKNYDEPLKNPLPKLFHEKREDGDKARFTVAKGKEQAGKKDNGGRQDAANRNNNPKAE